MELIPGVGTEASEKLETGSAAEDAEPMFGAGWSSGTLACCGPLDLRGYPMPSDWKLAIRLGLGVR